MSEDEYRVLFTVRRVYYDAIVAGEKTCEVRKASKRWMTVGDRAESFIPGKAIAVFMCGAQRIHRRRIISVDLCGSPEEALGRPPSEQGRADIGDGMVVRFNLGEVVP